MKIAPLHFQGHTRDRNLDRSNWAKLLPQVSLSQPVAALDLGSNAAKLLILEPDYTLHKSRQTLENGKSIGQTGKINKAAKAILDKALRTLKEQLNWHGVRPDNVRAVATAGLRSARNGFQILKNIRKDGIPIEMISFHREAELIYPSVLVGEGIQPHEKILVIEIGGGSTELAYGNGPDGFDKAMTGLLETGTGRLNLEHPFSFEHVQKARRKVKKAIGKALTPDEGIKLEDRRVFIKSSDLEELQDAHLSHKGQNLLETSLTHSVIRFYLSRTGLSLLKNHLEGKLGARTEMKIITKLLILDELMKTLDIPEVELGFNGGLKFAVLNEHLKEIATHQRSTN